MDLRTVTEQLKDNYDQYYDEGISEWRRLGAIDKANDIVALCDRYPHSSILEIGAGEGAILKRLSDMSFGQRLAAIEISSTGVETIIQRNIPHLVECQLFDGYNIPFEDKTFDLSILTHVLEHVEHPRQLLYESARVAKYLFIEVPLEDTLRLSQDYVPDKVGHINFYSPVTFRRLVQSCGLRIIDQKVVNPSKDVHTFYSRRKGLINHFIKAGILKASRPIATRLFTYHSAILCEKV